MSSSIRSRSKRWWGSALLAALFALVPMRAAGAEPTDEAKAEARVKYSEGNAAYEQRNYREALKSFEAAYQLVPLPGFLYNVAQCHRLLGDYTQAASAYRRYLALSEKEPDNADTVKGLIAEMDSKARQQAASRAAASKPVATKPAPQDRPEAPGRKPTPEKKPLDPRPPSPIAQRPKPVPPGALPSAPAPEVEQPTSRKWWLWAGAGAAALVAGGVIYAVTAPEPRPTTLGTIPGR